jgi:hypothetical protein
MPEEEYISLSEVKAFISELSAIFKDFHEKVKQLQDEQINAQNGYVRSIRP